MCHHTEGMPRALHTHSTCDAVNGRNTAPVATASTVAKGASWNGTHDFCKNVETTSHILSLLKLLAICPKFVQKKVLLEDWLTAINGVLSEPEKHENEWP